MQRAPKNIFIIEEDNYVETSYEVYEKIREVEPQRRFWMFGGMLLELPEAVYVQMNREKSRQQYIRKLAIANEFSYDAITTDEFDGADILVDKSPKIDESVERKILLERLGDGLLKISESELSMIRALYFQGQTEKEYATELGISQAAVHKRKKKVLEKLRKLIE